jgi:glycosyltransferase involved in cell wall biosynthesis
VLVSDAYGGHGGIAKFNRDLLASIAAMPECAEVVCLPRVISRPVQGIPERVRFVAAAAGSKPRFLIEMLQALRDGPYDVVIIGHINLAPLGVWAAQRLRVPSQLIVHGIDAWRPHEGRTVRTSLAKIDRIVGVSQVTLDRLTMWAGIDRARQRLLPNCVDLDVFTPGPKPRDLVAALGLAGRTVLMTFGRLASEERYKGFDEILDSLPVLNREVRNLKYVICGDGPDRPRLEAKARKLGLTDQVVFTGFVDEARKADYYRLADAYVMPSRGEGFGIVLLEAMACGIPVMGSRVDGSREALLDGALGELVDPARPEEIRTGVLRTLQRAREAPASLQQFSEEMFRLRVASVIRDLVSPEFHDDLKETGPSAQPDPVIRQPTSRYASAHGMVESASRGTH